MGINMISCALCKEMKDFDTDSPNIFEEKNDFTNQLGETLPKTLFFCGSCLDFLDQTGEDKNKCNICGKKTVGITFGAQNFCYDKKCSLKGVIHYHHCKIHFESENLPIFLR